MNTTGASTTTRYTRNGAVTDAALQPPHSPERFTTHGAGRGAEQVLAKARAVCVSRCTLADYVRCAVVAAYLAGAMVWLVASRQIRPNFSIRRSIHALLFHRRPSRPLTRFVPDEGHCFKAVVDPKLLSDAESVSRVRVYENGVPLPHAHSEHAAIRQQGEGRFSHWNGVIYFSASDNSDPRTNGRRYVYKEV